MTGSQVRARVASPGSRQWVGLALKIAISVGVLGFLLSRINGDALLKQFVTAQPLWLLAAVVWYFLAIGLGVLKWYVLTRVQHLTVSLRDLAGLTFAGLFLGNVLPSNIGGDVVRAYGLARAAPAATEAALLSVVVDRLLGLVAFFGAAIVNAGLVAWLLTDATQLETLELATVGAAAIFALACALFFSRRIARRLAFLFDQPALARFKPRAQRLFCALQMYRHNYRALALNVALSLSVIVVATLAWASVARALDLNVALIYFFLFNPLIAFVLMLPISLNGLGTKEATSVFFFGLVGVPAESALAMSLLFHAIVVVTSLPGGILWLRPQNRGLALSLKESPPK